MDCFTAVAGGDSTSGLLIIPQQQAGSFGARGSLYLPRLCSIPETAEPLAAAAQRLRASEGGAQSGDMAACAAAAAAQRRRLSGCGDKQQRRRHAHSSPGSGTQFALDSDSSGHSSSGSSSCTSSARSDASDGDAADAADDTHAAPAPQEPAVVELAPDHPAPVLANTWSYNVRHFTDCVPVTASLAAHHSSCGSSGDACAQNRPAGSCSSSRPGEAPPLLEELALHDLDASEWQPWDRVARWLDGHNSAAAAAAAAAASPAAASDMAALLVPPVRHRAAAEQQQPAVAAAPAGPVSSSSTSSRSRHKQQHQQQGADKQQPEQQQQQESGEFDAPDWWQASVVARLEEQREAFHGSLWSRFKAMTGLAA